MECTWSGGREYSCKSHVISKHSFVILRCLPGGEGAKVERGGQWVRGTRNHCSQTWHKHKGFERKKRKPGRQPNQTKSAPGAHAILLALS